MNVVQPSGEDRQHLTLFRAAAAQVRQASVIDQGKRIAVSGKVVAPGEVKITTGLLESEPFRSLAISVRLAYQNNEPSNFGHVCNILDRAAGDGDKPSVRKLRAEYNRALNRHNPFHTVFLLPHPRAYSPRDFFETWLYHGVFHHEPSRKADYDELAKLGEVFAYIVQGVVLQLAGRILDLDDIVADTLQEPRVPRIPAAKAGA